MSTSNDDHGNMVTCKQIIIHSKKANRNGRIYPTTNDKGDDTMENRKSGNENTLSNENLNSLKDMTESMKNLFEKFLDNFDENSNEPNTHNSSCKCGNRECTGKRENNPDHDEDGNVREMVDKFADHLEEVLGHKVAVLSMDELESMCGESDDDDHSDDYDNEIIARLQHLEEGLRIIMRGQSDSFCRIKPVVSKKHIKKLERKLDDIIEMMYSQQQDIDAITKVLTELTAPKNTKEPKSGK